MLSAVREFVLAHAGISCSTHVDDFGIDLSAGSPILAARRLQTAVRDLTEPMHHLGLKLALPKQALLASSARGDTAIRRVWLAAPHRAFRDLGVDFIGGKSRSHCGASGRGP